MKQELNAGFCHRCGAELVRAGMLHGTGEGESLFCTHCGAPQLVLPDYMRVGEPEVAGGATTAVAPPPASAAESETDWRAALGCGAVVAGVGALLTAGGMVYDVLSLMSFVWVSSGAVIAISLYRKRRPAAAMDLRVGFRMGIAVGLMMLAGMAVALGTVGVVARFGVHRMGGYDAQVATATKAWQAQVGAKLDEGKQTPEIRANALGMVNSEEVRAGVALMTFGFVGGLVLALSAGGGAFAGMLSTRRDGAKGLL